MTALPTALPVGIENGRDDARVAQRLAVVVDFGADGERGRAGLHLRRDERAPLLHVDRIRLHQPHVAVDSRALVEPAVARRGVHAHQQHIAAAGIGKIGDVEAEGIVAAAVAADVEAVEDHHGFAVGAVELDRDALARVRRGKLEDAAVPADAGRRIVAAERIEAFARQRGIVLERAARWPSRGADRPASSRCRRRPASRREESCPSSGSCRICRCRSRNPSPDRWRGRSGSASRSRAAAARGPRPVCAFCVRCARLCSLRRRQRARGFAGSLHCGLDRRHSMSRCGYGRRQQAGFEHVSA